MMYHQGLGQGNRFTKVEQLAVGPERRTTHPVPLHCGSRWGAVPEGGERAGWRLGLSPGGRGCFLLLRLRIPHPLLEAEGAPQLPSTLGLRLHCRDPQGAGLETAPPGGFSSQPRAWSRGEAHEGAQASHVFEPHLASLVRGGD